MYSAIHRFFDVYSAVYPSTNLYSNFIYSEKYSKKSMYSAIHGHALRHGLHSYTALYSAIQRYTLYSYTAIQRYTLYNLYNTPLSLRRFDLAMRRGSIRGRGEPNWQSGPVNVI